MTKRLLALTSLCALLSVGLSAQKPNSAPLSDYVGTYDYGSGQKIELVAGDYNSDEAPPNKIMIKFILPVLIAAHASAK